MSLSIERMHLREVAELVVDRDTPRVIGAPKGGTIRCSVEYMGDRLDVWFVALTVDGVEHARHNAKYVSSVTWKKEEPKC